MKSESPADRRTARQDASWLRDIGRLSFWASYVLAFSTPSWQHGVFALWPVATIHLSGESYAIGLCYLLPVVSIAAGSWASPPDRARGLRHHWLLALSVAGWALLVLVRAWPARGLHASVIATVGVGILGLAYLCARNNLKGGDVIVAFAVLLLLQGVVGCAQFALQRSVGLTGLGELALSPEGTLVSVMEISGRRFLRAYGLTGHPNLLGGYLVLWLLVCMGQAIERRGGANQAPRAILWAPIALGVGGVFCSFSRSAWLGLLAGLAYFCVLQRDRVATLARRLFAPRSGGWRWTAAALMLCGILVGVTFASRELLLSRFVRLGQPLENRSLRERAEDMVQAWGLVRQHPWLGVGSGSYLQALWDQAGDNPPPGFRLVHNIPLLAWAELGVLGPILWLWMLLTPPVAVWCSSRRRAVAGAEVGWAAAFVAATVFSFFDSYLYLPMTWWPAWGLGVLAGGWARGHVTDERGGPG